MSTCSAAEIEEKRRIALEKLKAKKAQLKLPFNKNETNKSTAAINLNSNITINENNKIGSNACNVTNKIPERTENKASSFLSALKGSNVFVQRQQEHHPARDSAHPYKRPSTEGTNKDGNNFCRNSPYNGFVDKPKGPTLGMSSAPQKQIAPLFMNSVSCKVELISVQRFEVQPSSYHAKLIEVFKTIPSRSYGKVILIAC